ncbi:O-antigen ligase family protein [Roseateles sp. BYS78W]|uniref:O-antigen ligase family protein n=1 Tax=Pelomonas candidula TaxID=3299025 RepID=A0ABW7HA38_9BURK
MLRLAYIVELTWLLVDTLSGFLQNHNIFLPGDQTVSALVRLFAVGLFIAIILRHASVSRLPGIVLLFLCFVWIGAHMMAQGMDGPHAIADLQFLLKLLTPVLLYTVLQIQFEQGALDGRRLHCILGLNAAVLLINLSLGLFGIGFGNYGETEDGELLGSKGFFYAGNEVSATLVAVFALVIFAGRAKFQRRQSLLLATVAVFFIASLVSLSKTSLLGFLLILLFVIQAYLSRATKIKFTALLTVSVLATSPWWIPVLQTSIDRWEFMWERSPDFITFITSGRADRIDRYVDWLYGTDTPWHLLFGEGQSIGELAASFENDLLDLTYNAGLLGLLVYGIWFGWMLRGVTVRWSEGRREGSFTAYILAMFLLLSMFAGHVMYSATLAPFVALLALSSARTFPGNAGAAHGIENAAPKSASGPTVSALLS